MIPRQIEQFCEFTDCNVHKNPLGKNIRRYN